jgi:L-Ala-D/L-Glu epimerase
MSLRITATVERWPVAGQFVIARGAKTYVDVLVVAVSNGVDVGMGEGTAIYYRGETAEKCLRQVEEVIDRLQPMGVRAAREATQNLLGPGAARNALDCAFWNLEARATGVPLWQLAGLTSEPQALATAFTISLGEASEMEHDAAKAADRGFGLLKLKLTGEGDRERVAAVRKGAPGARLIVDANESWGALDVASEAAALAALGVEMIEQPVPPDQESRLLKANFAVPTVADESCHEAADVKRLAGHYDGINIKLDRAGGLTEALRLRDAARAEGMKVMVGCMLSTSLGIAPAFLVAQGADWVDLDGPALLAEDRPNGFVFADGMVRPRNYNETSATLSL